MPTHTKKAKPSRRTVDQRAADHRRTVRKLRDAVADIHNAEQDGLLYCSSIRLASRRIPWLQVIPGIMSLWWPYTESPHVVLVRDVPCILPVRVLEWSEEGFAVVKFQGEPSQVAAWIDLVFRNVYNCKPGYDIDADIQDLADPDA